MLLCLQLLTADKPWDRRCSWTLRRGGTIFHKRPSLNILLTEYFQSRCYRPLAVGRRGPPRFFSASPGHLLSPAVHSDVARGGSQGGSTGSWAGGSEGFGLLVPHSVLVLAWLLAAPLWSGAVCCGLLWRAAGVAVVVLWCGCLCPDRCPIPVLVSVNPSLQYW